MPNDEKTQKKIDSAVSKAVREERRRVGDILKGAKADAGTIGDRDTKRAVTDSIKAIGEQHKNG